MYGFCENMSPFRRMRIRHPASHLSCPVTVGRCSSSRHQCVTLPAVLQNCWNPSLSLSYCTQSRMMT